MDKKFVCKLDGRRFKTNQALIQHRQASHGSPGQKAQAKRNNPQPVRASRMVADDLRNALVAQPQRVLGKSGTDQAVLSGTDRLLHVEELKGKGSGSMLLDFFVAPGSFKRLSKVASAFQRIRYRSLVFRVEPQISATSSGGYVAGFVSDPDDYVGGLDELTSTAHSVTTKMWQSASVTARIPNRLFYTSVGIEPREQSPGRFLVMVDGSATQEGSMTVFCDWSVELSGAILEQPAPKEVSILKPVWIRKDHQGVWAQVGTGTADSDFSDKASKIFGDTVKAGQSFRLPIPVAVVKANDQTLALHHWLYVRDADSVFLCPNGPADWYEASYQVDNLVIDAGEVVKVHAVAKVSGEDAGPSSSGLETMTAKPKELHEELRQLTKLFRQFLQSSALSPPRLPECQERSGSVENSSSMESLHMSELSLP